MQTLIASFDQVDHDRVGLQGPCMFLQRFINPSGSVSNLQYHHSQSTCKERKGSTTPRTSLRSNQSRCVKLLHFLRPWASSPPARSTDRTNGSATQLTSTLRASVVSRPMATSPWLLLLPLPQSLPATMLATRLTSTRAASSVFLPTVHCLW